MSRTVTVDVEVDLEDFTDCEILQEVSYRKLKLSIYEVDDEKYKLLDIESESSFIESVSAFLWELDTSKVALILEEIKKSRHSNFLEFSK
jgi:hypothetical protein